MSVQGVFNTQVTKTTGMWVSNAWVQFSALLFMSCGLACGRKGQLRGYRQSGAQIRAAWRCDRRRDQRTVTGSMAQLGPAKAAFFIVMSQLIVAYLIEVMGLFSHEKEPLEWRRVISMVIALIGVAVFSGNSTITLSRHKAGCLQFRQTVKE